MKINKFFSFITATLIILNFSVFGLIQALAHSSLLNVAYDSCEYHTEIDHINEAWYVISDKSLGVYHIDNTIQTIKYYFADESISGYRWDTDISQELAEEIKTSFANSMKKWNNVYIYSYDSKGNIEKNKVINIVEGTFTDHNLTIYPTNGWDSTAHVDFINQETVSNDNGVTHSHGSSWRMTVNVDDLYYGGNQTDDVVDVLRERTGAHEIGHILGLRDIDTGRCGFGGTQHHEELLMGYGEKAWLRQTEITYKDLAGVAITRGFHTDADHKWLNEGQQSDGTYKLRCSLCNGVRYVANLNGYVYDMYNACNGNHELSDGNMMAVASYGTSDYY